MELVIWMTLQDCGSDNGCGLDITDDRGKPNLLASKLSSVASEEKKEQQ